MDKRDIIRQIMAIAGKEEASEDVKTIAKLAEKLAYDKSEAGTADNCKGKNEDKEEDKEKDKDKEDEEREISCFHRKGIFIILVAQRYCRRHCLQKKKQKEYRN